jgi:hypothetical protein
VDVETFYPSKAVIKLIKSCRMKQACKIPHVDTVRDMYTVLLKTSEGVSPWRPSCKWQDNIKDDFNELGCEDAVCISLAHVANATAPVS